ncbi:MAG: glycosyltransferase family 39 protein, partial [Phycisphaerales bacterium]
MKWYAAAVILLLMVHSSLAISSLLRKGITFDEVEHISAGYAYLKFGDWRFNAEHPPLTKLFAAIPLVLGDAKPPEWEWGSPSESDGWKMGQRFLFDASNDTQALLNQARTMMVVWSVVLGLVVYGWSAHLFGRPAGVLSLALYSFSPSILAHARLVTMDLPLALGLSISTLSIWYGLGRISAKTILARGASLSVLFLTKISAVVIVPVAVILLLVRLTSSRPMWVMWPLSREVRHRLARLGLGAASLLVDALIVWMALWACYGFRYAANPAGSTDLDDVAARYQVGRQEAREGSVLRGMAGQVIDWMRATHFVPEAYIHCIDEQSTILGGRDAFLHGEQSVTGWWYFFPYCFAVKTATPVLVLCAVGLLLFVIQVMRRSAWKQSHEHGSPTPGRHWIDLAPLWTLLAVYAFFAITCKVNLGLRYILPVYPPLFVLVGSLAGATPRFVRAASWACAGWLVASSLWIWPDYLAYFNSFVGGPGKGYRHLVDSSLDWGQDLPGLRRWLDVELGPGWAADSLGSQTPVYLSYFGADNPGYRGIACQMLPSRTMARQEPVREYELKGGLYCISATRLQQVYLLPESRWTPRYER